MPVYAALLRGINVGGHNKVPMTALRQVCTDLGLGDVASYIQSGNVVFSSATAEAPELTITLERGITAAFGFEVPVVLRSGDQLAGVLAANPFVKAGKEPGVLSVGFLADFPEPERLSALGSDPLASPPPGGDEFIVAGREVFLHHPNGYGRSKLTNSFFDRRLGTLMTVRNWKTVAVLVEMTG